MVVHQHKLECHMEELDCNLQSQGHSQGLQNQTVTVSVVSSELLVLLLCLMIGTKIALLCSMSRSQQRVRSSLNVCLDGIFQTIEPFVAKCGIMIEIHHQEPEYLGKRLFCYHQGQGHDQGSCNQIMMFLLYLQTGSVLYFLYN